MSVNVDYPSSELATAVQFLTNVLALPGDPRKRAELMNMRSEYILELGRRGVEVPPLQAAE